LRWEFVAGTPAPETLLVLVDDTEAGASLRQALSEAFDDWDSALAIHHDSCAAPVDPATWQSIDRSVVFIHPSTPDSMGYWGPSQDPALRLQAQRPSDGERSHWMEAVRVGINAQPAPAGAPFQALLALQNAESLLDGSRLPTSTSELELLNTLPSPLHLGTVIALATEDASPAEANQYLAHLHSDLLGAVLPAAQAQAQTQASCARKSADVTPRYGALSASAQAWPCKNPDFFGSDVWSDCSTRCLQRPIAVNAAVAQCRAMAKYPGSEPCPTEFGWLDPLAANGQRAPRVEGSGATATRVCEIRQLEGAALASCVERLDCADCVPGWCATEVDELVPHDRCTAGSVYPPFRFVLGAAQAHQAQVTVVCNEAAR